MKFSLDYSSRFRILKGGKISLVVSAFIAGSTLLHAAPSGGVVTSGTANIAQSGAITNITQSSQKASINWNDFSIKAHETVNFNQPNASAITLNRVVGNERSVIDGALNANGQVWLLNSNGVLFGKNASINTAGLLATTSQLSDKDFNAGNYNFTDASSNSIINLGTITISDKGYAVLTGKEVENQGNIIAVQGKVHLVGAEQVSINLNGNSLLNLRVDKGTLDAIVKNSGSIKADGGEIYLTTNAVDELLKGVVNNTGIIEANSLGDATGYVELFAHGGTGIFDGKITAEGGFVETSGKEVDIKSTLEVKAKDWLIDPTNITINDATAYQTSLNAGTSIEIATVAAGGENGDITVATSISKTAGADATLTLKAHRDIIIDSGVSISSTVGKLNTILWSDSDANGGGITMNAGSEIATNGGHLWMGGGIGTTTWNSLTVGDSYAKGTGIIGTSGLAFNGASGNMININTNGGNIKMYGSGPVQGGSGVFLNYTSLNSGVNGGIDIKGDGYYTPIINGNGHGVKLNGSNVIGGSSGVTVTGRANNTNPLGTGMWTNALILSESIIYATDAGLLKFNLDSPAGQEMDYIGSYNGSTIGHETSQTGNIEITTTGASIYTLNLPNILTSGNLIVDMSGSSTKSLTQSSGSKVAVGGTSSFKANANTDIKLINADNDFTGSVLVDTAKSLSLLDENALTLGSITGVSGKIDVATTTGDITVAENISKTTGGDATLTLKAAENIKVSGGKEISSTTGKLNTVLWSDSDATNGGGITMNAGSSITTNGGHLWMGGGSTTTTWNGLTVGNSYAKGTGTLGTVGISFNGTSGNTVNINTNGGNINMYGRGPNDGGAGVLLAYTNLDSGNGRIEISGDGHWIGINTGEGHGIRLQDSNIIGGSGGVTLKGNASANNTGMWSYSLLFAGVNNSIYAKNTGVLELILNTPQLNGNMVPIVDWSTGSSTLGHNSLQTGDIKITNLGTSTSFLNLSNVATTGNLIVDTSTSSTQSLTQKSGTKIEVGGTSSFKTKAVTDITLINADNDFKSSVSVETAKSLSLLDKDTLILGSITGVSEKIDVATTTGNITLNGNIATASTTTDAIIINAGKSESKGTSTGGNIVHQSGTITTGVGGRATLYTGSIAGSTALATLIGSGTNRFRYNSDELLAGYTTVLGSGLYAIYREQPTISINPNTKSMTYSDALSSFNYASSGYLNGDTDSILSGTANYEIGGTKSTSDNYIAGSHDIKYKNGLTNGLGYAISDGIVTDELTITPKAITVSATDLTKVYGEADATLAYTATGLVGTDTLTGSLTRATGENVNATGYAITQDTLANANYTIAFTDGKYIITPRAITITGITAANKTYDGTTTATLVTTGVNFTDMISGDTLTVATATGAFADKEVGTAKTVSISNLALAGTDAGNYNLTSTTAATTADITAAITPPTPPAQPTKPVDNIITSIVNGVQTLPPPQAFQNTNTLSNSVFTASTPAMQQTNTNVATNLGLQTGSSVQIVSVTSGGEEANTLVSLSDIKEAMGSVTQDVTVPLASNSIIDLINGGVRLPDGVEQLFLVVEKKN